MPQLADSSSPAVIAKPTVLPASPIRSLKLGKRRSPLSALHLPTLPSIFDGTFAIVCGSTALALSEVASKVRETFPHTSGGSRLVFEPNHSEVTIGRKLNVGVVFSGGPAPGMEYLLTGLYTYLFDWNTGSKLYAFQHGPQGLVSGDSMEVTEVKLVKMQEKLGPSAVGCGSRRLRAEDFPAVRKVCEKLALDGLVVAGGNRNNTDVAYLAEYFAANEVQTKVVAVAKRNEGSREAGVEMSFGFDSMTKHFSVLVGNVSIDAASTKSAWHFIRVMSDARSGDIVLEVGLQSRANVILVPEEIEFKGWTLME
eukprot:RCo039118